MNPSNQWLFEAPLPSTAAFESDLYSQAEYESGSNKRKRNSIEVRRQQSLSPPPKKRRLNNPNPHAPRPLVRPAVSKNKRKRNSIEVRRQQSLSPPPKKRRLNNQKPHALGSLARPAPGKNGVYYSGDPRAQGCAQALATCGWGTYIPSATRLSSVEGTLTIICDENDITRIGGANGLARVLKSNSFRASQIKLIACNQGVQRQVGGKFEVSAQQLANELKVPVEAALDFVTVESVRKACPLSLGGWKKFYPQGLPATAANPHLNRGNKSQQLFEVPFSAEYESNFELESSLLEGDYMNRSGSTPPRGSSKIPIGRGSNLRTSGHSSLRRPQANRPTTPSQPRYLQVSKTVLKKKGWDLKQAGANAYWPANQSRDHIHLGIPTNLGHGRIAEDGNVFVTYVSIKQNNELYERLRHDARSGYFSSQKVLPNDYRQKLIELGIFR